MIQAIDFDLTKDIEKFIRTIMVLEYHASVLYQTIRFEKAKFSVYDSRYNSLKRRALLFKKINSVSLTNAEILRSLHQDSAYLRASGFYLQINPTFIGKRAKDVIESDKFLFLFDKNGNYLASLDKNGYLDCYSLEKRRE